MRLTPADVVAIFDRELSSIDGVTLGIVTSTAWPDVADGPREQAVGMQVTIGGPVSGDPDDGHHVLVQICPEIIVRNVAMLPVSPEPESTMLYIDVDAPPAEPDQFGIVNDVGPIAFADNYVTLLAAEAQVRIFEGDGDPVEIRGKVDEYVVDLHPGAGRLTSLVEFAALDLAGAS